MSFLLGGKEVVLLGDPPQSRDRSGKQNPAEGTAMGVMRLGYVHIRVTDLAESRSHYGDTLGMKQVHEEPGKLYFKGWDEYDHHSAEPGECGVSYPFCGSRAEAHVCQRPANACRGRRALE